ncbi:hypothetical protein [Nocardioides dongxiaopingii]|uniref:hypothetical protein n=1 Tax=Nocardioides dongxiaopingii TaxID=2576036 RepID=UPI0010C76526|nr:hypothetical protein [Nocardioides dongxiaopingii]
MHPGDRATRRPLAPHGVLARLGVLAVVGGLVLLTAAPGTAAGPVAQATATALTVSLAGTPAGSETYAVTHDGTREAATGTRTPVVSLLGGQSSASGSVLTQDATASVVDGAGRSAACAGLAGRGAGVGSVGDGSCLTPGDALRIDAGTLDLSGVTLVRSDLLQGLDTELQDALAPLLDAALPAAQDGLATALTSLGDLGLTLDLDAVQSWCSATTTSAEGGSRLAGAALAVEVARERVEVLSLPADPAPNTRLATGLDEVVATLTAALTTQLETGFDGVLAPAGVLLDELESALQENVLSVVAEQLAPLEENLLDAVLNKQVRAGRDSIEVTALDVEVLPAARQFGFEPLALEVGRSTCGPGGRVVAPPVEQTPSAEPRPEPTVPTSVPAGLDGVPAAAPADGAAGGRGTGPALLALGVLALAAGLASYRHVLR